MNSDHRLLLQHARELFERYHVREKTESFNIFSILRNVDDEVNLHSRFLVALLDHRSPDAERWNLSDFLLRYLGIDDFGHAGASIRREYYDIDILITSGNREKAVVIENKIRAADQYRQLIRYYETVKQYGFKDIFLVYLTVDEHAASPDSVGDLNYLRISYTKLIPWLLGCKKHAQDEPSVRESIAQYIHVIRKLTGTDSGGSYMNELRDLCLENDNILLAYDLRTAIKKAQVTLLHDLWDKIERELRTTIPDLPGSSWTSVKAAKSISDPVREIEPNISRFVNERGAELVLRFPLDETNSGIGIGADSGSTYFGVYCHKDCIKQRTKLADVFRNIKGSSSDRWAWYRFSEVGLSKKDASKMELQMLLSDGSKTEFAQTLSFELEKLVWQPLQEAGIS